MNITINQLPVHIQRRYDGSGKYLIKVIESIPGVCGESYIVYHGPHFKYKDIWKYKSNIGWIMK